MDAPVNLPTRPQQLKRLCDMPSALHEGRAARLARLRRRRLVRRVSAGVLIFLLVIVLAAGAALVAGPVPLPVGAGPIAAALDARLGAGTRTAIGRLSVGLGTHGLRIELDDLVVRRAAGGPIVAAAERISAELDLAALLGGQLAPRAFTIADPIIAVSYDRLAGLRLGFAAPQPPQAAAAMAAPQRQTGTVAQLLDERLAALDEGLARLLPGTGPVSGVIQGGALVIEERGSGELRTIKRIEATAARNAAGVLRIDASAVGRAGRFAFLAERAPRPGGGADIRLRADDISLVDLLPAPQIGRGYFYAGMPAHLSAAIQRAADGSIGQARAVLDVDSGYLRIGREAATLVDEGRLELLFDPDAQAITIAPSGFVVGGTRAVFIGRADLSEPLAEGVPYEIRSGNIIAAPRDTDLPPMEVGGIDIAGRIRPLEQLATIDRFVVDTLAGSLNLAATFGYAPGNPTLTLALDADIRGLEVVKQLWPFFIAPRTRRWVIGHVATAERVTGELELAYGPDEFRAVTADIEMPAESLAGHFTFVRPTIEPFEDYPAIALDQVDLDLTGARAEARLVGRAEAKVAAGAPVTASSARFVASRLGIPDPDGYLELKASGPVAALGALIEAGPLKTLSAAGVPVDGLSGDATLDLSIAFPLREEVAYADVELKAQAELIGFASRKPLFGHSLDRANLAIAVEPRNVSVHGEALVDGVPATIDVTRDPRTDAGGIAITAALDDAARRRLGLDLGDTVEGTISVSTADVLSPNSQRFTVDLTNARLSLPVGGWTKPVGRPGEARFELVDTEDGKLVRNVAISAGGLEIRGEMRFDEDGRFLAADLPVLRLASGDSASATIRRSGNGLAVRVRGQGLTLPGTLLDLMDGSGTDRSPQDLSIDIDLASLSVAGRRVRDLALEFRESDGSVEAFSLKGVLTGGGAVTGRMEARPGTGQIVVQSTDAGELLRILGIYERIGGGQLTFTSTPPTRDRSTLGRLIITRFNIIDDPSLGRLIASGPASADPRSNSRPLPPTAFSGSAVRFDQLSVVFRKTDQTLVMEDGVIRGPMVGATVSGAIDLARRTMALRGTYVPAYGLNNLFNRVPVLGALLGGRNEGLLGVTFAINGPLDQPVLSVNPISVLAPGVFRKIFEFR